MAVATLRAREAEITAQMLDGRCESFEAYRFACGQVAALREAVEAVVSAERSYMQGDDE